MECQVTGSAEYWHLRRPRPSLVLCHNGFVNPWTSLVSIGVAIVGVFGVLAGAVVQARLAARQQCTNRVHDERIRLYLDVYAECYDLEQWLMHITWPSNTTEGANAP